MQGEYKRQMIMFIIMVIIGVCFNPMNALVYRSSDIYMSLTIFYGGLLMAFNMMWAHEVIHYLYMGMFNSMFFFIGLISSIAMALLLRSQLLVDDTQWLKRMIGHHSTALTTSHIIYRKTKNPKIKQFAKNIIVAQEKEIAQMKIMI